MALKVWLPLDGDLTQQGTEETIISGTPLWKSYGKIGTNALNLQNRITCTTSALNGIQFFTVTFWARIEDNPDSTANWMDVIGFTDQTSTGSNGQFRFETGYGNAAYGGVHWHDNTTNAIINGSYIYNNASEFNNWHHIAITVSNEKVCSYYDGELKQTQTSYLNKGHLTGNWWIGESTTRGCIQDVRIYDCALSPAEVKEISRGLVLHYKLDGPMGGANENIILTSSKVTSGGQSTNITREYMNDGSLKIVAGASNGNYASIGFQNNSNTNVGEKMQVGDTYTISCDIKVESGTRLPTLFINSGNGYKQLQGNIILNQWIRAYYTSTWAEPGSQYGNISLHLGFSNAIGTYYFKNFKLEKGSNPTPWTPAPEDLRIDTTKIEDSSGYGHNGEIISELHTSNDTARHNSSTLFDGVDDCIIVPYNTVCPENIFTINLWFKKDAIGTKSYETLFGGPSGFEMDTRAASATSLSLYMASTRSGNRNSVTSLSLGNWYMITMTRDGTKEKYYVNGIFQSEIDAKSMPTGNYYIGAWQTTAKQNYYGLISDFRIYCTPLLDTDIKQLYNVSMKVDNLGNIHTYELEETNGQNKILKTGITKSANFFEDLYYDKIAHIGKQMNDNILNPNDLEIITTNNSSIKTGSLGFIPAETIQALAGKTLIFSYDVCTSGERLSEVNGDTAYNKVRYGIHGAMSYVSASGTSSTNYPFASYLTYSGDSKHTIQTWTIPTNYQSYGNLNFSIQNFDKPSNNNSNTWFIKNVRLEIQENTTNGWISGTNLIEI